MTKSLAIAVLLLAAALVAPVRAHDPAHPDFVVTPGPEAGGCYFSRGRMFCGRYCYWEINGKRYCQPRASRAFPQGEIYIDEQIVQFGPRRRHRHPPYPMQRQTIK